MLGALLASTLAAVATYKTSNEGVKEIQQHEGVVYKAYLDVAGIPTICTGSTAKVVLGHTATAQECKERLQRDLATAEAAVKRCTTAQVTQKQYDQLTSLVFNIGGTAYCKSTLVRELNAGRCVSAGNQFLRWRYVQGKEIKGLATRRQHESTKFKEDC